MTHAQVKVEEASEAKLQFLNSDFDAALLGFAENHTGEKLACYGYQVLKTILRSNGCSAERIYAELQALAYDPKKNTPLILHKINRKQLWNTIRAKKYPRWDYLDTAISGLAYRNADYNGVVYNKTLCLTTLLSIQKANESSQLRELAAVTTMLDSLISVDLGINSPWFVTQVK